MCLELAPEEIKIFHIIKGVMNKHSKYRLNNPDKIKEANNKYYRENRDEICERKRQRYQQQREKILSMMRDKSMCEHCQKLVNSRYLKNHIIRRHSQEILA